MTTFPVKLNTFTIVNDYFLRNIVKLRNSTAWIQRTGHNELLTAHDLLLSLKKYDKRIPVNVNTLLTSLHQAVVRGPEFSLHTCTCSFIHSLAIQHIITDVLQQANYSQFDAFSRSTVHIMSGSQPSRGSGSIFLISQDMGIIFINTLDHLLLN